MTRLLATLLLALTVLAAPVAAQEDRLLPLPGAQANQGGSALESILQRQEALEQGDARAIADDAPPAPGGGLTGELGTLGAGSDADVWGALRANTADVSVSAGGDVAKVLVQDGGMRWLQFREGPLRTYGGGLLLGVIALLAVYAVLRGRIRIEGGRTGVTVTRFNSFERASHWLLAGSFILLGVTGLLSLFGRVAIAPLFGHEANAGILIVSKWVHNNVAWPFMLALAVVFLLWVWHNIPDRTDLRWVREGGGLIGHGHPPARKFNFGQKMIFWSVIILGASISASGLSLLFPFELPMFAKTFAAINATGLPGLFGTELSTALAPHEEMQLAQAWHGIVSFVLMAIVIAHIYLGSYGMEGAYDAMGSGEVDVAWAEQHHALWLEEMREKDDPALGMTRTTPAE